MSAISVMSPNLARVSSVTNPGSEKSLSLVLEMKKQLINHVQWPILSPVSKRVQLDGEDY